MGFFSGLFKDKQYDFNIVANATVSDNIEIVIVTDPGNVRTNNEDLAMAFIPEAHAGFSERGFLLVLADGMGGHNSGEIASEMAIKTFGENYYRRKGNVRKAIGYAIKLANEKVYEASLTGESLKGMGTTLTAIAIQEKNIYLAHVGDSRAFIFKNGYIEQLSNDHTLVQHLLDTGEISQDEAKDHPQRNVLVNALGTKPFIEADIKSLNIDFEDGDIIFLCSDGLYEYISPEEFCKHLQGETDLKQIAEKLVNIAKQGGGQDNITLLLAGKSLSKQVEIKPLKATQDCELIITKE